MLKILTPDEMRRADRAAIGSGTPSFRLMRAAGRAVAREAYDLMGGTYGRRVLVLAGKGNNGGDGLVAARELARQGAAVTVLLTGDPAGLRGDARTALESLLEERGRVSIEPWRETALARELERAVLVVDALAGTGFSGALRGPAAEAADLVNRSGVKVLAVDIPSGVNGENGRVEAVAVRASRTVTFAALKPGLLLHPGADYAGEVKIADIGISEVHMESGMELPQASDLAELLPSRPPQAHKRSVGKVLVVAGSAGMSGAAILAASGALRAGGGLVRVAVPISISKLVAQSVTEALVIGLPETSGGFLSEAGAGQASELAEGMDCVALGPGIGREPETTRFVHAVMESTSRPVILDADGISAYVGRREMLGERNAPVVLTPHAGELAKLLDADEKEIAEAPLEAVRRACESTGATVLLKGHPTLVTAGGTIWVVNTGGPFLATAGTGDVLTGVVAALAAKVAPEQAAWAGAWLHGSAGLLAASRAAGASSADPVDRGIIASDLLPALPEAIHRVRKTAA